MPKQDIAYLGIAPAVFSTLPNFLAFSGDGLIKDSEANSAVSLHAEFRTRMGQLYLVAKLRHCLSGIAPALFKHTPNFLGLFRRSLDEVP